MGIAFGDWFKILFSRNSLAVQWSGLGTFTAGAWVQSLVRELRSRKLCGAARKKKDTLFLYQDQENILLHSPLNVRVYTAAFHSQAAQAQALNCGQRPFPHFMCLTRVTASLRKGCCEDSLS